MNPHLPDEPEAETVDGPPPDATPAPPSVPSAGGPPANDKRVPAALPNPFGRYQILRPLGQGGMGAVYLAHDTQLDRLVALKVPHLEWEGPLRERFHREARAAATLHHPNICPVYDVGVVEAIPYFTMAYIEGNTLAEWARESRPTVEIVGIVRTLALALAEAHGRGVVHRDLKPSNVLIDRRGDPILTDFGLARRLQHGEDDRLTREGVLLGTPAYMPPEYVLGQLPTPDPCGDVYSLGVILYELLAGRVPFSGRWVAVLALVVTADPEPLSGLRPDLDPRLVQVCQRAMARRPEDRFPDMGEFARALAEFLPERTEALPDPSPSVPGPAEAVPDRRVASKVLELLRTWGWAQAIQKIRRRVTRSPAGPEREAWQSFLNKLAEEKGELEQAFVNLPEESALLGWALAGKASYLLRGRDFQGANRYLERAESLGDPTDRLLQATIAHTRASTLIHQGRFDEALPRLHTALDLFGARHFMLGRVLDTLGMAYACKGNFPIAREFFEQSISRKESWNDEAGVAISHGQLGRLYLDWGHLDEAELHFQKDLQLVQKLRSRWGEVQIYNHLGQVALARGEREQGAGRRAAANRHWAEAAGWLDESIRRCQEGKQAFSEGFARKDRALVHLRLGEVAAAEEQTRLALALFHESRFAEGTAKVQLVEGMILRQRGRFAEAERKFRAALGCFESLGEAEEGVHTQWEIARTLRDSGASQPLVTRAFRDALLRAESSQFATLVQQIEEEWHEVDREAYLRHIYRRVRGASIDDDSPSLTRAAREPATALAIDLPGFNEFAKGLDPEAVLLTFNQILADFTRVLDRSQARVVTYRGNGLLALVLDNRHAERAVGAALDIISALEEFNHPRRLLDLPIFSIRIGVASGDVLLGNVGTYHKMDFTALGGTVNLASALRNEAEPGLPCLGRSTFDQVRDRFHYRPGSPRAVKVAGFGPFEVWDAVQRR